MVRPPFHSRSGRLHCLVSSTINTGARSVFDSFWIENHGVVSKCNRLISPVCTSASSWLWPRQSPRLMGLGHQGELGIHFCQMLSTSLLDFL